MAVTCNPFSLFNWFLMTFNHFQQHFWLVSHRFGFCTYERSDLSIISFQSKMALCVPKVMILGHSFVRRLSSDWSIILTSLRPVHVFGVGGSTVKKIKQFDVANVSHFAPVVVILEIGTNDLCNKPPETVGSQIDELLELLLNHFSVKVVGVCLVIKRSSLKSLWPVFNL